MAQQNLDLLTRLAYLQAGGRDPGQRDIDKINAVFGGVSNVGKTIMDYLATDEAMKKSALERKKLEQETMPAYKAVGGTSPQETQSNLRQVMKAPIPAEDLISGNLASTQRGIELEAEKARLGQDIYSKYGPATIGQAKDIETAKATSGLAEGREFVSVDKNGVEVPEGTPGSIKIMKSKINVPKIQQDKITPATPVIKFGLASRDYVKMLKPTLKDDEDMGYAEFTKRASEHNAQIMANREKPLPSEEVTALEKIITAQTINEGIKNQYFNLISKGKSPVDPVIGRWTDLKASWGILGDEEQSKFMADMATQFNTYLNTLSGAAISVDEAKRLEKRINSAKSTPEQFLGKLQSIQDELDVKLKVRSAILKSANYRIDMNELKKLTGEISYGDDSKKPKMKNLQYKSPEEVRDAQKAGKIDKTTAINILKLNFGMK